MANPNGRKGAQYETDVMRWFREHEAVAERLTKAGAKDEGDEAKNYAKARGLATIPPAFVIVKRRNHGIEKSWVVQDLEQWMRERYE